MKKCIMTILKLKIYFFGSPKNKIFYFIFVVTIINVVGYDTFVAFLLDMTHCKLFMTLC